MDHLRVCHSKSPLDTRTAIVLPYCAKFKATTKELKLIKQVPKGEKVLLRTTPSCTHAPRDIITYTWVNNLLLIDAKMHVLSPTIATNVNVLKPSSVTSELEPNIVIQAAHEYLSA